MDFLSVELVERKIVDVESERVYLELRPQFEVVGVLLDGVLQFVDDHVH